MHCIFFYLSSLKLVFLIKVEHAFKFWKTGEFVDDKSPRMFFSSDNYDDKVELKGGTRILTRRVTVYLSTVKNLNQESWAAIFEAASDFLNASRKKKKGRSKSASSTASSDIFEEPAPEFILVSDDE